jgi:signal transduction histidine kinase/ActR/RegA family two-component response regulator
MLSFKNLSIRLKIIFLIVAVSTINTIFLTITQYYNEKHQYFRNTIERLRFMSKVIGESSTASILFKDEKTAESFLLSFKVNEYVENTILFLPDSSILAKYNKSDKPFLSDEKLPIGEHQVKITDNFIVLSYPVIFQDEIIGSIRIDYNLQEFKEKQKQFIYYGIIILIASTIIATILAFFFQKVITRPVYKLEQVMDQITREKDYSIRSQNKGIDEIGKLSIGFNSMISQIEQQNNELKNAKVRSDDALKAKERFLANITHELRTPLSSIIGLTTLIQDTNLNQEQSEYFENIKTSSEHLLSIINDLLEFSKLGSGKFQFEKKIFSIRHTIARIEGSLEFELKNRQLNFETKINDDVPKTVVGDEFRLNQILINLIGNAIKFTPQGKVEVIVQKKTEDEQTITLEFQVNDTGIGISKDKQQVIFESFTQESSNTNRKYGGTGLGLTITKQLIELQLGRIRVESEKDKGSRFIFHLPFDKKIPSHSITKSPVNSKHEKLKIILVDDNEMILKLTKSILQKNDINVSTFTNGLNAINKLKSEYFDCILLDLHMPEVDGFEIAKTIRALDDSEKNNIPIIALTAAATNNEIQKCFETGMNDYIVKPFNKDDLISKLLTLCKK